MIRVGLRWPGTWGALSGRIRMNTARRPPHPSRLLSTLACTLLLGSAWAQTPEVPPPGTQYYSNGMLREQVEQTRSRRVQRSFYPSGILRQERVWAMDGLTPIPEREVEFSAAGVLLRERRWAAGAPVVELEFQANGQLISKKEYSGAGATRELQVQTFFSSGVLASDERYAVPPTGAPRPIGTQRRFSASGLPQSEQVYDENGRLTQERQWSPSGEPVGPR